MVSVAERYEAAMVLSGVGDALGYKHGEWEFNTRGKDIHKELKKMKGGVNAILVALPGWPVSDDTIMHMATAKALVAEQPGEPRKDLIVRIAREYKDCMRLMSGRAPGMTCMNGARMLEPDKEGGCVIPFNPSGGGCGAAMRAMCIGLRYPSPEDIDDLVSVAVESGRMTHNHPTGHLGSLATALFTSYAIQGKLVREWGHGLMQTVTKALEYIRSTKIQVKDNEANWEYFTKQWTLYLTARGILDGQSEPTFPEKYGVEERDVVYTSYSWGGAGGWGGASGHDAPLIAYDALLGYDGTWEDLCLRAMFHGGDSDSTGVIAGCCYGAMHGYQGVGQRNYSNLEFRGALADFGKRLYELSRHGSNEEKPPVPSSTEKTEAATVPANGHTK